MQVKKKIKNPKGRNTEGKFQGRINRNIVKKIGLDKSFSFFYELGRVVIPTKIRPGLRDYLLKAGIEEVPYSFIGAIVLFALFFSGLYVVFAIVPTLPKVTIPGLNRPLTFFEYLGLILTSKTVFLNFLKVFGALFLALLGSLFIVFILFYVYFEYRIFQRTVSMEKMLPDFLREVSQNLKAGLTLDKALWNSIDPAYKELSYEIRLIAKRVMVGEDLTSALFTLAKKYNSSELLRTFSLIAESNKSGSEMALIVDHVVESLEKNKALKDEIRATSTAYTIFISVIVLGVIPLLFSIAFNLIKVLAKISTKFSNVGKVQGVNLPLNLANLKISFDPHMLYNFIFGAVVLSSFTASLLISIVRNGDLRATPKYVLIYTTLSTLSFILIFKALSALFSSLFSIL